ncbi:hypothetical protein Vafri_15592 [Volvox africanus]|nr:hypothetical protein Vafri_15592 [Volvox africanus]
MDNCERQAEHCRIGKSPRQRSSVSQKVFDPSKLFFRRGGGVEAAPIINSSQSTGVTEKLKILDDADEESALPASPQIMRRTKSQNCTLARHSRGFRIEETGEPDEHSISPFHSLQMKKDKERLPTVSAFMFPSARRIVCEGSFQGCAASNNSPCSDVGVAATATGGIAASPRRQFRKAECPPALSFRRDQHRSGHTVRIHHCRSDSDSDSDRGRGTPLRTGAVEVAGRAAPIELGRRRSEHGITHRGRRQTERRRASCWTAHDDLANSSSGSGDEDNGDESDVCDGDVDDCAVPLVVPTMSMPGSRRVLRPPSMLLVALGSTTPDSNGSTAAETPSSPAMAPMFKSAPAPMAATAVSGRHTEAMTHALVFKSFQDVPWPQPASLKLEDVNSSQTVLQRATSLRRTALSPQADGEQHGAAGPLLMPASAGSSCCAPLDESPRQHGGRGGGGGSGSSSGVGCTPRTSFDMAGDLAAASASAAARRAVLKGWSSKGLQVHADNSLRRNVTWQKPNGFNAPEPVLPPQQQPKWQQQQAVCAPSPSPSPSSSSGLKLSERALCATICLVPDVVAGPEPTGDSRDGTRVTYGNILGNDDVNVLGVQEDGGDCLSSSLSARGLGTPRCGGAEKGLLPVRLPRLLHPISPSCQQGGDFTGLPWSARAKSSSAL